MQKGRITHYCLFGNCTKRVYAVNSRGRPGFLITKNYCLKHTSMKLRNYIIEQALKCKRGEQ